MAATPPSFCPQCGTPLQGNQRFCTNCGTTIEAHAGSPTIAASNTPSTPPAGTVLEGPGSKSGQTNPGAGTVPASFPPAPSAPRPPYAQSDDALLAPPPPPPIYNPYASSEVSGPQSYAQTTLPNTYTPQPVAAPPPQAGMYQVPVYAQKQKGNRGCVITSVVLLLVLALGIGGVFYLVHTFTSGRPSSSTGNTPGASGTTGSGTTSGTTPTSGTHTSSTQPLNLQFTYASVQITILSVELAPKFDDDTSTNPGAAGVVRVNIRENNPSSGNPDYILYEAMHLVLPGGTAIQAGNEQQPISPAPGVNRTNWVDFALDNQVQLSQLTLHIGKQTDNQMDIPLQSKADLSKYQDKTSNLNLQFKYGGVNLTLKTATLSYSSSDYQATTGNRYLILTLAGSNTTTNTIYTTPTSYMRLQVGGNSLQPDNTSTFPIDVASNASASGTAVFLVPQDATSFTLIMLAQPDNSPPIAQATQAFQTQ